MNALTQIDDCHLVQLYVAGDENAFQTLLFRYKDRIFRVIKSKVKDHDLANDIFQDVFIKVINTIKLGQYNEEGKFLPWVMRIAHNLIIDHFRKTSRHRHISESSSTKEDYNVFTTLSCDNKTIEEQITTKELLDQMVLLVDYLPDSQRKIINMRIFQDLSFKEIAEIENISINTALGRMRYALLNIRKMIEKHGIVMEI